MNPQDYFTKSVDLHKKHGGKLEIVSKVSVTNKDDLSIAYSPGIAEVCRVIAANPATKRDLVMNGKAVAVISDGSAILGLGNLGPEAALPVMEGKALLFKQFAGIDSIPLVLATQDVDQIVATVTALAPSFAGINLEDISAPRCFEIEKRLKEALNIPVFHDDQHGTAIVVLAGFINALQVVGKTKEQISIVINGSGAAGVAIAKLLAQYGCDRIMLCDTKGIVSSDRGDLNPTKLEILQFTNKDNKSGSLTDAIVGADVFIGVSAADVLTEEHVKSMNKDAIVFALANPNPEIKPELAKQAGVAILATGRSDYPNQVNNVLVFPGIFRGAIDGYKTQITEEMKLAAAKALAALVPIPSADKIIPEPFEQGVMEAVRDAVMSC